MQRNLTRLLPWLLVSVALMVAALIMQQIAPSNVLAVTLYKAHLLSLGGWTGYWLDRGLFPYDRPHEYLLPEEVEPVTLPAGTETSEGVLAEAVQGYASAELVAGRDYGAAMIRRAIIVAAALICVGLGA